MAKIEMTKAGIVVLKIQRDSLLEELQRFGMFEPLKTEDSRLQKNDLKEKINLVEKNKEKAEQALAIIKEIAPEKGSLLGMLKGRKQVTVKEYKSETKNSKKYLKYALDILDYRQKITEARAEIVRCETALKTLEVWESLDIPMQYAGTEKTAAFIGTLPELYDVDRIYTVLAAACPEDFVTAEIVRAEKTQTALVVFCQKKSKDRVYAALRELGFTHPSDPTKHPPRVRIERIKNQLNAEQKTIDTATSEIIKLSSQKEKLEFLVDFLNISLDELEALQNICNTEKTVVLEGYIPKECIDDVKKILKGYTATLELIEPDEEEDVPVLLKNNGFAAPVEGITEMYAMPSKRDIDPSSVMAFFYYLLFGIMLSDAGYGVLMVLGTAWALKKTSVEGNLRRTLKMYFYCGISTVFWGALFGSWFGDIIPIIYTNFLNLPAPNLALWFEPIKDPIKMLLFSFVIGICHLFLGLITAGRMLWNEGKKWDAIWDTVPTMLLILGIAPLAAGILVSVPPIAGKIGGYLAIAGVVLIILTSSRSSKNIIARILGGVYGLYNIASGYLSDILSYSRLLALGLATGSIAGVVNMMGSMPQNLVVKGIMLTVVFIIGHALNMAINVLGAYVHTNRLQFVELFSKFYEGGGRAFKPFKMNTKFIEFKEENKNE